LWVIEKGYDPSISIQEMEARNQKAA